MRSKMNKIKSEVKKWRGKIEEKGDEEEEEKKKRREEETEE